MKKRNTIFKYSLSAIAFIGIHKFGLTQIILTDPEPDLVYKVGEIPLEIDLDNDENIDFSFNILETIDFSTFGFVAKRQLFLLHPEKWNNAICDGVYAIDLESNYLINQEKNWEWHNSIILLNYANLYNDGVWNGIFVGGFWWDADSFQYLAVKFKSNNYHFGWIRLKVDRFEMQVTISDYAFNSQPDASIATGDIGNNTADLKANFLNDKVFIQLPVYMLHDETTVEFYEISGRRIYSNVFSNPQHIEINAETLATGVYLINAYNQDVSRSAKVFVYRR